MVAPLHRYTYPDTARLVEDFDGHRVAVQLALEHAAGGAIAKEVLVVEVVGLLSNHLVIYAGRVASMSTRISTAVHVLLPAGNAVSASSVIERKALLGVELALD